MPPRSARSPEFASGAAPAGTGDWLPPSRPGVLAPVRAAGRTALFLLFTALSAVVQTVLLRLPGRPKLRFARFYWRVARRLFGVRVRVLGTPARGGLGTPGRPVIFAANHSSWLDIAVLGGTIHAPFIAKKEVGEWPVARTVARLGRTVFVSRRARDTGDERDDMRERLRLGDDLIFFPEGTSNDGSRVLPFRTAFFSVADALPGGPAPLLQPVSVVYDRQAGLPIGRATRARLAWYGDMELAPHFWSLAGNRGAVRCTVLFHAPLDPAAFPSRKALAAAVWTAVAEGAAALRQGRGDTASFGKQAREAARAGHDRSA